MKHILTSSIAGLIFGAGLTISNMVDPVRVLAFLDVFGDWDPRLAFVIGGGLFVYLPAYYLWIKPKGITYFGEPYQVPSNNNIDRKLLIGASIFGVGWGLTGICPGPAITSLSGGQFGVILFVFAMLLGMMLSNKLLK